MNNYIEEKLKELSKVFPLIDDRDFEYQAKIIKEFIEQVLQEQEERIIEEEYQRRRRETSKAANVNYFSGYEKGIRDVKEKIENLEPSYSGVLDSNERRRGYELAWAELREELLKELNI